MSRRGFTARAKQAVTTARPIDLPGKATREFGRQWQRAKRVVRVRRRVYKRLMEKELEWDAPWSMRRPKWWRKGFLSRSSILYRLDENGPELYISDVQRYRSTKRMVHARLQDVINNKLTTHLLLKAIDVPSSELLGVYARGAVHSFPGEERTRVNDYLLGLEEDRRIFVKPFTGAEGKRVHSIRRMGDKFKVDGEMLDADGAAEMIRQQRRPMVVEAGVEQHPAQRALFAETTNTIRILTMLDIETRQPFIVLGVQRIGTERSGHVDNWSQGGLSASIDLDSGVLSRATWLPRDNDNELRWFDDHPETGSPIAGQVVPFWEETKEVILRAARTLSFLEYVGWDVILGESGPIVLEANINSGMNVLQVHKPLLADPRARAYFERRGVVKRSS
ncbi:sugar-transfer associated ATP-grasp domain-containing protein [Ilumatobacter nonamiensis]|uniref:sugar-transfer associated ATP-grasp domain-containing protein n=1 Tax=Ilumatobacter nonamiensis TaxID=467093 RepID=UPI0003482EA1|nr:sugar-transfer associated ATP-grasp domain-containing protein [Ilumatobacter nonamiensis]